jgi:hypothetical protein
MLNTKFFIGSKVKQPKNVYLLDIKLMHGDADAYTHLELEFIEKEKHELIAILDILSQLGGHQNYRKYHNVQGFDELLYYDWDLDSTCDGMYLASYDGYKLYYFNEDGEKFNVKVIN